jgi:hypothetical protein
MKHSEVYDWHKRFLDGREGFDDVPCSGRPSESKNEGNVDRVREIVRDEQKESVDQTTEEVVISVRICQSILHDVLNMRRLCQYLVSRMLTPEKQHE